MSGQFIGDVKVVWDSNTGADRDMTLLDDFAYVDPAGTRWEVPAGTTVNGASIPSVFWSSFGPPFVGDYRRASVVHDHFCVIKTRTAAATHRMFRDACRTGGVGPGKAALMYSAVNVFGPQWTLPAGVRATDEAAAAMAIPQVRIVNQNAFDDLQKWIESEEPSLDEIDRRIEEIAPLRTVVSAS